MNHEHHHSAVKKEEKNVSLQTQSDHEVESMGARPICSVRSGNT